MQVYKIDKNGYYIRPIVLHKDEEIPSDCIEIRPPQPCYKPRWNGDKWVEEGTPPEPKTKEPTLEERLSALEILEIERMFEI